MRTFSTFEEIESATGEEVGTTEWVEITQERVDQFADATGDHQWIHVDVEKAKEGPFGGTIAHGFLTLSLLSRMAADAMHVPDTTKMAVNYGLDRVRFLSPVKAGKRVRGHFTLDSAEEKSPGQLLLKHSVTVEIEGETKPALVADWIGLIYFA